jgi:hypothetical protein
MKLKKLGAAMAVVLALAVIAAGSASASAVTEDTTWRVGSSGTLLAGSESISTNGSGELTFEIGSTKISLKYTGLNCTSCSIENSGGTAVGDGELEFTGVTVVSPATCAVSGGKLVTKPMKIKADYMGGSGSSSTILLEPVTGTTWATITFVKGSGTCALGGSYNFGGSLFIRANNATGVYAASQTFTSSAAINAEAGGSLIIVGRPFWINGTTTFALSGARKGEVFGTEAVSPPPTEEPPPSEKTETKDATWRAGAGGTVLTSPETVSVSGSNELDWTVGSTHLQMKSTGLECLECKIENSGGTGVGSGKLKFTGVTLTTPSTCSVNGGTIVTLPLKISPDWMKGTTDYVEFTPSSGTTFATIKIEKGTGSCSLSGSYLLSGRVFTRSNNATGVYAASQTLTSSGAINAALGGELSFMSGSAELNGTATFALSGAKVGQAFGTHE